MCVCVSVFGLQTIWKKTLYVCKGGPCTNPSTHNLLESALPESATRPEEDSITFPVILLECQKKFCMKRKENSLIANI